MTSCICGRYGSQLSLIWAQGIALIAFILTICGWYLSWVGAVMSLGLITTMSCVMVHWSVVVLAAIFALVAAIGQFWTTQVTNFWCESFTETPMINCDRNAFHFMAHVSGSIWVLASIVMISLLFFLKDPKDKTKSAWSVKIQSLQSSPTTYSNEDEQVVTAIEVEPTPVAPIVVVPLPMPNYCYPPNRNEEPENRYYSVPESASMPPQRQYKDHHQPDAPLQPQAHHHHASAPPVVLGQVSAAKAPPPRPVQAEFTVYEEDINPYCYFKRESGGLQQPSEPEIHL